MLQRLAVHSRIQRSAEMQTHKHNSYSGSICESHEETSSHRHTEKHTQRCGINSTSIVSSGSLLEEIVLMKQQGHTSTETKCSMATMVEFPDSRDLGSCVCFG